MSDQTSNSPTVFTALVWQDPDRRTVQWNPRAFVPAVLFFNHEQLFVLDADGYEVLGGNTRELDVTWLGKYRYDLTAWGEACRLYFMPPNTLTRRHDKAALDRIGGALSGASEAGHLGNFLTGAAVLGDYAVFLGFVGKALALRRSMSEHQAAKVNTAKLKEVLAAA